MNLFLRSTSGAYITNNLRLLLKLLISTETQTKSSNSFGSVKAVFKSQARLELQGLKLINVVLGPIRDFKKSIISFASTKSFNPTREVVDSDDETKKMKERSKQTNFYFSSAAFESNRFKANTLRFILSKILILAIFYCS